MMIKRIGFYGKLPSYGDFITRNVAPELIDKWDNWLSQSLECAQLQLKEQWHQRYLNAPVWRFLLPNDDDQSVVTLGMMMPSTDKVGRIYSFAIFLQAELPSNVFGLVVQLNRYFEQLEDFAISLLDVEELDLDEVQTELEHSSQKQSVKTALLTTNELPICEGEIVAVRLSEVSALAGELAGLIEPLIYTHTACYSAWWTSGSQTRCPQLRIFSQLPAPHCFDTFLEAEQVS
ncbi:type VI secretion system-associated protein TagF [Thalassotalea euphylliae]|uniref:Type VI secretion system-associated protein TagF n=1 Tax=Thalassotalea euphylliae TaxID=1655234 RepID=A0A3E0TT81_9GAMM|nr:type VI secretion system-associated protein TagF [Thalassotalea euphylliae]REL27673.1 type VI secretion system-associated protein TagF [Thalassotalea euphylliae]